jgi:hypothetical protein
VWWRTHVLLHVDSAAALRLKIAAACGLPSSSLPWGLEGAAPRVAAALGPSGALGTESIAAALALLPWSLQEAALQSATRLLEAGVLQRSQAGGVLARVAAALQQAVPPLRPSLAALVRAHAVAAGVGGGVGVVVAGLEAALLRRTLRPGGNGGWVPAQPRAPATTPVSHALSLSLSHFRLAHTRTLVS